MDPKDNELDIDLDAIDQGIEKKDKIRSRIEDLSQKVKLTAKERDELKGLNEKLSNENKTIAGERDFYKSAADVTAQYPAAKEHMDEIKAKVLAGYSMEDATVAVLNKVGKLNPVAPQPNPAPQPKRETAAGGSATTTIPNNGQKQVHEMTRDEKRQALLDAESRGELSMQ